MESSVRRLKVNKKLAGSPCPACAQPLALGEDAAQCAACEAGHHAACWDGQRGCSQAGCVNAPLQQLDLPPPEEKVQLGPEQKQCPHCKRAIYVGDDICPICNQITSPDGIYHGVKMRAPGAMGSLVWGLVGIVFFGIIVGPHAIKLSNQAKELIRKDPRYEGAGLATAGYVLGILDIVLFIVGLFARLAK